MPRRSRVWLVGLGVLGLPLLLVAALAVLVASQEPGYAAMACPRCFGFEHLRSRIYVESHMDDAQRASFAAMIQEGEARVSAFYGGLSSSPIVLACATPACADRLGSGTSLGGAYLTLGLRLAPGGLNTVIITHERSHIEFHQRLGVWRWMAGAVPAWFDEGLAVLVADDRRYVRPDGDRCLVDKPRASLPRTVLGWVDAAASDRSIYADAACYVGRWMAANGGREAVLALVERVAAGGTFDEAYRQGSGR